VLSGDADAIVPVGNSRNLAAKIPGAELRTIEGGSHLFFIERPEEFNRILSEFLERR
jgi:pimeloyl-ACP methyl ester carboxylesterase